MFKIKYLERAQWETDQIEAQNLHCCERKVSRVAEVRWDGRGWRRQENTDIGRSFTKETDQLLDRGICYFFSFFMIYVPSFMAPSFTPFFYTQSVYFR